MGRVVDRIRERLGPADKAIIQARRVLLAAIALRASEGVLPRDADWQG